MVFNFRWLLNVTSLSVLVTFLARYYPELNGTIAQLCQQSQDLTIMPHDQTKSISGSDDSSNRVMSSIPWPGSTFIIRSVSTGDVLTLLNGQIVLTRPGHRGSHWECMETKGWLGFQNTMSGKFLGHDRHQRLVCVSDWHDKWEHFVVRMKPEGGIVLLLEHWERLWHVGIRVDHGVEVLAKMGDGAAGGIVWEFVKVR